MAGQDSTAERIGQFQKELRFAGVDDVVSEQLVIQYGLNLVSNGVKLAPTAVAVRVSVDTSSFATAFRRAAAAFDGEGA